MREGCGARQVNDLLVRINATYAQLGGGELLEIEKLNISGHILIIRRCLVAEVVRWRNDVLRQISNRGSILIFESVEALKLCWRLVIVNTNAIVIDLGVASVQSHRLVDVVNLAQIPAEPRT